MQEVLPFIDQTATKSSPIIIAGDFNCRVGTEQYAALRVDEILQRTLDGDTGVDHLFAYKSKGYTFELLKSDVIEEMFPVEGGESELSDHAGHMATIRITPTS